MVNNRQAGRRAVKEQQAARAAARERLKAVMATRTEAATVATPIINPAVDVSDITPEQLAQLEQASPELAAEIRRRLPSISGLENVAETDNHSPLAGFAGMAGASGDVAPRRGRGRRPKTDTDTQIVNFLITLYAGVGTFAYAANAYDGTVLLTQSQAMAVSLLNVAKHHKAMYDALVRLSRGGDYLVMATVHLGVVAAIGVNHGMLPRAFFRPFAATTGIEEPPRTTSSDTRTMPNIATDAPSAPKASDFPSPSLSASNYSPLEPMNPATSIPDGSWTMDNGSSSLTPSATTPPTISAQPLGAPVNDGGEALPPEQNPAVGLIMRRE